jgi:hypothetical protein
LNKKVSGYRWQVTGFRIQTTDFLRRGGNYQRIRNAFRFSLLHHASNSRRKAGWKPAIQNGFPVSDFEFRFPENAQLLLEEVVKRFARIVGAEGGSAEAPRYGILAWLILSSAAQVFNEAQITALAQVLQDRQLHWK